MRKITSAVVCANALMLLACSAGYVPAAETRTPTPEEFRELVRKYNESGNIRGQSTRPVTTQQSKAFEQYSRAVTLHTKKDATPSELKEAASLYQAASDAGMTEASNNLAMMYLEGKGVKKDVKKSLALLNAASKKGVTQADIMLARMYLTGKDVKMDEKKGAFHLNKAAKTGNPNAVKNLAEYLEWKKKNEQAMKQYQELLKKAQLHQIKPQVSSPTPLSVITIPQPSTALPLQPAPEPPFSVIPGNSYFSVTQPFTPAVTAPQSAPVVNVVPKRDATDSQPEKVQPMVESGNEKGVIRTRSKPAGQEQSLRSSEK